jgi:hypothetical protein
MRRVVGHQLLLGARQRVFGASGQLPTEVDPCPGDVDPDPALGRVHDYLDTNDLNRRVVGTLSAEVIR